MPQMAPLMWLNIMMTTLLVIFLLMLMVYFSNKNITRTSSNYLGCTDNKKWLW